jgi:hypothetical protein
LWAAVLLATVEDLKDIHTKAAAEAWFNSTSQEVGTFLWICEALGLDANAVRRSVN